METQNTFTEQLTKEVFIDDITPMGSAFAATPDGEAVFINARIVSAVKIKHGDRVRVLVLPNYEDKRDRVRWRALRAEVIGTIFETVGDGEPVPSEPVKSKDVMVMDLLQEYGPLRTSSVGRLLNIDSGEAGALCHGLYAQGKIALANVYSSPDNNRASHRVWAVDINEFDIDPFEEE
jgi:hypothetical protein